MTTYLNNRKQFEERAFFRKLSLAGRKIGIAVTVFTPEDVQESNKKILFHVYDPKSARWTRKLNSFPQAIYDRCRYQAVWRFRQLKQFRSKYPHLIYLNRPLANKWTIHQLLRRNARIRPHLPETVLFRQSGELKKMLEKHRTVFLKPINGTGGRGILRIEKLNSADCLIQGRDRRRHIISQQKKKIGKVPALFGAWNLSQRYIVQQGLDLHLNSGRVHDYRMLVQKNGGGEWEVTGCAGRIGPPRSITSNLHGGGRATTCEQLLNRWLGSEDRAQAVKQSMQRLGLDVVHELEARGFQVCELALDIAVDRKGKPWLLEVNPKPSREVFSQSGQHEAYRKSIDRPLEYALWVIKRNR